MLIEWLLDALELGFIFALELLPGGTTEWVSNVGTILSNLGALNYFLPIAEAFVVVVGILLVFPVFMGTTFLIWILALLRGGSARG